MRDTPHVKAIKDTVARLALACATSVTLREWPQDSKGRRPYETLGKWEHLLGFPGHFATNCPAVRFDGCRRIRRDDLRAFVESLREVA